MASADPRRPIASAGTRERPQTHLEPVVEAELSWGNQIELEWGRLDKFLDDRSMSLMRPLHIEKLRETFRFPPHVLLSATLPRPTYKHDRGRLVISDTENFVMIYSPLPEGWTEEGVLPW